MLYNYTMCVNLHLYAPYMCCAGSLAAMQGGHCLASIAAGAAVSVGASVSHRTVPVATGGIVPIVAIPVAVVAIVPVVSIAVVAVGQSVVYQGSVLVLTELADQLGLQS